MLNDIRIGLRLLWREKTFALASATTLAICIGANVTLFSIVDHVLLRPLPWPDADRIVLMANQYPGAGVEISSNSGVPDYYDRLRETTVFDAQALYNWGNVSDRSERLADARARHERHAVPLPPARRARGARSHVYRC